MRDKLEEIIAIARTVDSTIGNYLRHTQNSDTFDYIVLLDNDQRITITNELIQDYHTLNASQISERIIKR